MTDAIYLTDMGRCVPAAALAAEAAPEVWQVAEYETAELSGRMIAAQATAAPPDVSLPLDVTGWHAVSVGFWPGIHDDARIKIRFSNEDVFTVVDHYTKVTGDRTELFETF